MNMNVKVNDVFGASVVRGAIGEETASIKGRFGVECRGPDGVLKWSEEFDNTVVTVGKNSILDTVLGTGAFMGLIGTGVAGGSGGFTSISAADTMSSHAGWQEVGLANVPAYTGNRPAGAWSAAAAGAKALSSALSFAITSTGTVKGAFIVFSTGASATKDTTTGVLLSAGLFTGGDKAVANGDTLNVSYTLTLT